MLRTVKKNFIAELIEAVKRLNIKHISSKETLEWTVQEFADKIWFKYLKIVNNTKHSKSWWNKKYQRELERYRISKQVKNWKNFKSIVKKTKHVFFNTKIQEIAAKNCNP